MQTLIKYFKSLFLIVSLLLINPPLYAESNFAERPDVHAFIQSMVSKHHFDQRYLLSLFSQVKVRPQIMRHVNKPLESEPWHTYQLLFVSDWRIKHGVEFWNKYENVLREAERIYNVPASIIVATIGIETKYGQRTGDYRVMDSLTNIAFSHSSRAKFFRQELEQFLLLTREEKIDPMSMMGSYAGAIGQPQFMPSSYRAYAVNFSKSGKTDLMHDEIDVIGSIANYYHKHGWKLNQPIAVQAYMMGDRYHYLRQKNKIQQPFSAAELAQYGIIPKRRILSLDQPVKVIELQSHYNKEYWLGFKNFDVIKRYNASDLYAMAVYQLSGHISALKEKTVHG